jgi:hypothetical protein
VRGLISYGTITHCCGSGDLRGLLCVGCLRSQFHRETSTLLQSRRKNVRPHIAPRQLHLPASQTDGGAAESEYIAETRTPATTSSMSDNCGCVAGVARLSESARNADAPPVGEVGNSRLPSDLIVFRVQWRRAGAPFVPSGDALYSRSRIHEGVPVVQLS